MPKKPTLEDFIEISLQDFEASQDALDWGDHPLHRLAKFNEAKGLKEAVKTCKDIDVLNNFKQTPLLAAAHSVFINEYPYHGGEGYSETIKILAEANADTEAKDIRGWSALQYILYNFLGISIGRDESDFSIFTMAHDAPEYKKSALALLARKSPAQFKEIIKTRPVSSAMAKHNSSFSDCINSLL